MSMRIQSKRFMLAVFVSIGMMTPMLPVDTAEAVSGTCYFNTTAGPVGSTKGCSETGLGAYGTNDVLTGRSKSGGGSAIPNSVNTKSEFVKFILGRFNNGGTQNRIGAAFIMQEMRGSRAWPGNAQRDDWVSRMNQSDVTVKSQWDSKVGRTSWYDDDKKNVFYGDHPNVGRQVINIYYKGKRVAQIEHLCGNMVAGAVEIPAVKKWDVDPVTSVIPSNGKIVAGETITWRHDIINRGPDTMTRGGTYRVNGDVVAAPKSGTYATHTKGWKGGVTRSYVTKPSDAGKRLCQSLTINPNRWSYLYPETSAQKCVTVSGSYELTPEATTDASSIVEAGTKINVTGTVDNSGQKSKDTTWNFSKIIVTPGGTIASETKDNSSDPCAWFANECTTEDSGTRTFENTVTVARLSNEPIPDLPVGTQVCWAVSVRPPSNTSTSWRHSAPVCVTIGKKPKLQVLGGDTRVRGEIQTSTSIIDVADFGGNRLFGSWTEYGVMSTGDNLGMASGAALRKGSGNFTQSGWSDLTFANAKPADVGDGSDYEFGNYESLPDSAAISDYFMAQNSQSISGGTFSLNGKASGVYRTTGNITVSGTANRSVIIISDGVVTIDGSGISYGNSSFDSLKDIPQVLIIAKDIRINDSVSTVDAWLIASDSINTCANRVANVDSPALTAGICNRPLRINGPVSTEALYLFRTAGSGTNTAIRDPAERFMLGPEAYLWAYNYGLQRSSPTTTSVVELPPRF